MDKKLLENIYLNKKYFNVFFNASLHKKRVDDLVIISKFYYKYNLFTTKEYPINNKLLNKWIASHKTVEDKDIAKSLIKPVLYISNKEFLENLKKSAERFNKYIISNNVKKYYIIIGANTASGTYENEYINIGKSNYWTILAILKYLIVKPYDILLNLNMAIEFSTFEKIKNNVEIYDYVFIDDASYSGSQLFDNTIEFHLFQKHYLNSVTMNKNNIKELLEPLTKNNLDNNLSNNENILIKNNDIDCKINVHIIVPYISFLAKCKAHNIELKHNINIHLYNEFFMKSYSKYYNDICSNNGYIKSNIITKLEKTYNNFNFYSNLIPIYFSHKMPDNVSTISYLLLSGIVINYSDIEQNIKDKNIKDKKIKNIKDKKIKDKKIKDKKIKNIKDIKNKKTIKKYKFVQFIKNCIYPKNKTMKPNNLPKWCNYKCPISQSKIAKMFIYNYLKKLLKK